MSLEASPAPNPNPYAAPEAELRPVEPTEGAGPDAADTRWHYLGRERLVKRLAHLNDFAAFVLAQVLLLVGVQGVMVLQGTQQNGPFPGASPLGLAPAGAFLLAGIWINIAVGFGLRRLQHWARRAEIALLGLLALFMVLMGVAAAVAGADRAVIPPTVLGVGALWFLGKLASSRTAHVFTPTYAAAIAETPYFSSRYPWLARVGWSIYLGILALEILVLILAAVFRF